MKKLFYILLGVAGLGFLAYVVSQKQSEARRLWDEALSKVPSPGCDCCAQED